MRGRASDRRQAAADCRGSRSGSTRYIAASQVGITLSGHGARRVCRGRHHPARRAARSSAGRRSVPRPPSRWPAPSVLISLTMVSRRLRRDGAEDRRAPVSRRRPRSLTTLPMLWSGKLYAWFIVILDRSSNLLRYAAARAAGDPPARALAGGDRPADRREPRRRPARAAGTGAAPPRPPARPPRRAPTDGAAATASRPSRSRRR